MSIEYIAESVDYGETLREICPKCNSNERSLSVTREGDGTVLFICFRASCGYKGVLGQATRVCKQPTKPKRKVWEGETVALPPDVLAWIDREWGITDPRDWYYTQELGGRIAMSIRSPMDLHRGWVLRNDGSRTPKALTYVDEGEVALSWYRCHPQGPTVVVEDIPSAYRASTYVNAVALCGTGVGADRAQEIREYATRPIYMALDQDATDQSFKWVQRYSLLWDGPRVLPLQQDLKYMEEADLCHLLELSYKSSEKH
jgi:hypothetical protein